MTATNSLANIHGSLFSEPAIKSLAVSLNAKKEQALTYANSVYTEIKKSAGSKNDLTQCDPQSLLQCMRDAASFQLSIDGRQHAHLIKYGNGATLQIGYRGYLAKVKEHYPDAEIVAKAIYQGDELNVYTKDSVPTYDLKQQNPFASGEANMLGVLVACTYTDNGRLVRKVETVSMERINRAKRAAKQKFIWDSDFVEKAKAAAIKNAFKIMFAELQGLQNAIMYDNEHNYDPQPRDITPKQTDDDLKQALLQNKGQVIEGAANE